MYQLTDHCVMCYNMGVGTEHRPQNAKERQKMKIVNKKNGRTIAEGKLELSKISDMEIDTDIDGGDTWVVFRYFCNNLIIKKGDFNFVSMVVALSVKDTLIDIEVNGDDLKNDIELIAQAQLTAEEREHLLVHIINFITGKAT